MADEIEVKAVVPDVEGLRRRLLAAGANLRFTGEMEDRRFDRGGELERRDEVLRVRTWRAAGAESCQIGWKGPARVTSEGYKLREERECTVTAGAAPAALLGALGYAVVHAIDRAVETYELQGTTLRIEIYPRMDVLLEVEGDPAGIEAAIAVTGIPRQAFSADSLADFVARFEARGAGAALLARP